MSKKNKLMIHVIMLVDLLEFDNIKSKTFFHYVFYFL